ncbi:MAG: prepilin-type N-terminal cleavage/methylation domain-containing protein [Candidatus Omnitrophota bacterium]
MKKGMTLIEVIIASLMLVVLAGVIAYVFRAVILSWSSEETRTGIDVVLRRGAEELSRDLRKARAVQSSNDEIRFTQNLSSYYIYYLYNAGDAYPPAFNQSTYELRKAELSGGINGAFAYGSGLVLLGDVLPPPATDMSFVNNLVTLDLSAKRKDETIRLRARVRPRNL